jgi:hypothetical protein
MQSSAGENQLNSGPGTPKVGKKLKPPRFKIMLLLLRFEGNKITDCAAKSVIFARHAFLLTAKKFFLLWRN